MSRADGQHGPLHTRERAPTARQSAPAPAFSTSLRRQLRRLGSRARVGRRAIGALGPGLTAEAGRAACAARACGGFASVGGGVAARATLAAVTEAKSALTAGAAV